MRVTLLLLVLALAACGSSNPSAADSPEDAARRVVDALRQNDFALLEPILMNADDLRWLTDAMRAANKPKAQKLLARFERDGPDKTLERVRGHIRKTFDQVRKEVEEEGIRWADVRFDRLHEPQRTTLGEIEAVRAYVRLRIGDKPGEIRVDSLMRAPRGWILTDGIRS